MSAPGRSETHGRRIVRIGVGLSFLGAGAFKLALPLLIPHLKPGAPNFGEILAAAGVPLPGLVAVAVCLIEMAGGLALLTGRLLPWASGVLAGDLVGAMVTLSVRGTFVAPLRVKGLALGGEFWRLPVEVGLLLALLWLGRPWRLLVGRGAD